MTFQDISTANRLVMGGWVMLRKVIGIIVDAEIPENPNKTLQLPIAKPMKAHVPGFRFSLAKGLIHKSVSGIIIRLQWRGWLGMSNGVKKMADVHDVLRVMKESPRLGLSSRSDNIS